MAERALGAGEHRVVVGEHRAGGRLPAEQLAVDARRAGDQAVGGGARDQVVELAPAPLGGDREAAVLDEGAGIDEVGDVLAGGPAAGGVAALHGLGTRPVLGQRPALEDLGQILALTVPSPPLCTRGHAHIVCFDRQTAQTREERGDGGTGELRARRRHRDDRDGRRQGQRALDRDAEGGPRLPRQGRVRRGGRHPHRARGVLLGRLRPQGLLRAAGARSSRC